MSWVIYSFYGSAPLKRVDGESCKYRVGPTMAGWWVAVPSAHTTPVILPTILLATCCLSCWFWGRSLSWGFCLNKCSKFVAFLVILHRLKIGCLNCSFPQSKSTCKAPTSTLLEDYSFGAEEFFGRLNSKQWWLETYKFQMPTPRPERKAALVSSQRPSGQFNGLVDEVEGKEVSKPPII